jgi:hypothetical protein
VPHFLQLTDIMTGVLLARRALTSGRTPARKGREASLVSKVI